MRVSLGRAVILVFGKVPRPGAVKTRLSAGIGPQTAANLYRAFLEDTVGSLADIPGADVRLCLADWEGEEINLDISREVKIVTQTGDGLGERLSQAFLRAFADGYGRVLVVGSDHPTLPLEYVAMAADVLEKPLSAVIGPTEDGGYYLLGLNEYIVEPFENMAFSTSEVFDETIDRIAMTHLDITILPPWFDIDEPEDLARLEGVDDAVAEKAPRTFRQLATIRPGKNTRS